MADIVTWCLRDDYSPAQFLRERLQAPIDELRSNPLPIPIKNNVVVDVSLAAKPGDNQPRVLPRTKLVALLPSANITPRFGAVIVRVQPPELTMLVWDSLSVVAVGSMSVSQTLLGLQHFRMILASHGFTPGMWELSINNTVFSFDLRCTLCTAKLLQLHSLCFFADEELFPGVFHFIFKREICMLFFDTGKGVGMGSAPEEELREYMRSVFPQVIRIAGEQPGSHRPTKSFEKARARERAQDETATVRTAGRGRGNAGLGMLKKMHALFSGSESREEWQARCNAYSAFQKNGKEAAKKQFEEFKENYPDSYDSFLLRWTQTLKFDPTGTQKKSRKQSA